MSSHIKTLLKNVANHKKFVPRKSSCPCECGQNIQLIQNRLPNQNLRMVSTSSSSLQQQQQQQSETTHHNYQGNLLFGPTLSYKDHPFTADSVELVKEIADDIRDSVREYTSKHKLKLVGISASKSFLQKYKEGNNNIQLSVDEGVESYSEWVSKTFEEDGIDYELWRVPGGYNIIQQIDHLITRANSMEEVHGILIYYPLFNKPIALGWNWDDSSLDARGDKKWSLEQQQQQIMDGCERVIEENKRKIPGISYKTRDDYYRSLICPERDVEGLCPSYHSRQIFRKPEIYVDTCDQTNSKNYMKSTSRVEENEVLFPCTALAVVRILKRCDRNLFDPCKLVGKRFEGMIVTIINRSEILGRPLASILANDGATVYSVDKDSILLYTYNKMKRCNSYIEDNDKVGVTVESCVKQSNVVVTGVPSSTYKIPSHWIQRGSTVINVAFEPNINEEELSHIPDITYIPQIGKVTIALLEQNLLKLHQRYHQSD